MIKKLIKINEDKCDGCGLCISACHEDALKLVDGKAKLINEDYCDGLGGCLPVCPTGAITFYEKDTKSIASKNIDNIECNCPSFKMKETKPTIKSVKIGGTSKLKQWPIQIKLIAPSAPYLDNCKLLVAADCSAFAYGNFHNDFMNEKITIIGCPKLDDEDYSIKLGEIIGLNEIKSVTILRMEVPCCIGIENAVKRAIQLSGKMIPWSVVILSIEGKIIENK